MELFKLFGRILINNDQANDALDDTEKKGEKTAKTLAEIGEEAGMMALAVGTAVAAIATGMGVKAVQAADNLQKAMNTLQAQTGATDAEMAAFEESAKRLYEANYGQSFDDIARSMSEIARTTGLSGEELETTTKNALALRDTFEFGVNETARTANSLMKQFGISSTQAYELIAQSAQQGADKNGDLLDTLNEYSGMFKAAGYTAEQFGSILVQGAKDGAWSIDKVGDAVKESNIRLKDGSKTSREAMAQIGLDYDTVAGQFAQGGELAAQAFNKIVTGIDSIENPLERNDAAVKLFGTQFEDLETTILKTLGNAGDHIDFTKDALGEINDVKYDSFGEALAGLGRQLETNFWIPLGEKIMPVLEEFIQWIEDNKGAIQDDLGGAVEFVGAIFTTLAKAVLGLVKAYKFLEPVIIAVTVAVVAQQIIGLVTSLYKAWTVATKTQTTVQWLLNAAMNASPFGLIALAIGAVIAIVVLLVKNWDWVKEKALALWGWVSGFMDTTIGKIVMILMGPIGVVLLIIKNWQLIKDKAIEIFGALKPKMKALWEGIVGVMKPPINMMIGLINTVINTYEKMLNFVASGINKIPEIKIPGWVPLIGGKSLKLPKIPDIELPEIPLLANGGNIVQRGTVMVGEEGPELLDLPRGAQVRPLDKNESSIVININNPNLFNDRDAEKLGDLITRHLRSRGIVPR